MSDLHRPGCILCAIVSYLLDEIAISRDQNLGRRDNTIVDQLRFVCDLSMTNARNYKQAG